MQPFDLFCSIDRGKENNTFNNSFISQYQTDVIFSPFELKTAANYEVMLTVRGIFLRARLVLLRPRSFPFLSVNFHIYVPTTTTTKSNRG